MPYPVTEHITRKNLTNQIFRIVADRRYCALMGPRGRGTSTLLNSLYRQVNAKPESDSFLPVFIDLAALKPPGKKADIVDVLNKIVVKASRTGEEFTGKMSSDQFSTHLRKIIQRVPRQLILLVDHIDAVPDDLARNLLFALRPLYGDRLGVVVAGSRNLINLTTGELSPFNVAEPRLLKPMTCDEARILIDEIALENDLYFTPSEVEGILSLVSGEPYLIKLLIETQADLELRRFDEDLLSIFTHAFPQVIDTWEKDKLLNNVIREIESNWSWLKLVADLIAGDPVGIFDGMKGQFQSPDMCIALERSDAGYTFANPFFEVLLKEHLNPLRLADLMVMNNRWEEAQKWYEASTNHNRGRFEIFPDVYTMDELVLNAFQSIESTVTLADAPEAIIKMAYHILGVNCVGLLKKEKTGWTLIVEEYHRRGSSGENYYAAIDSVNFQRKQETAEDGKMVITPIFLRREPKWVLCSQSKYPQSKAQRRAQETLMRCYANLLLELEKIDAIEVEVKEQRKQLELVSKINTTIQQSLDVKPTARRILKALNDIGYPNAMISLLTRDKRRVDAVVATGIAKPLLRVTKRSMDSGDILPAVVRSGERKYIPDASKDPRLAQDAVQAAGIKSSLVLPLTTRQLFGWKETGVFGALGIGNIPEPKRGTSEYEILNRFTELASIALTNARLHEETNVLAETLDNRLEALVRASMVISKSKHLDVILNEMLDIAVKSARANVGFIALRDGNSNQLVFRAVGGARKWNRNHLKRGYSLDKISTMSYVVKMAAPIVNSDVNAPGVPYYPGFQDIQSNCGVPVPIDNKVEGALVVESRRKAAFDEGHLHLLQAFGSIIGIVIAQSRDFLRANTHSRISRVLSGTQPLRERLNRVCQITRDALGAGHCSIYIMPEGSRGRIVLEATTSGILIDKIGKAQYQFGEGLTGWIAGNRKTGIFQHGQIWGWR